MASVIQDWVSSLSLMQQAVLIAGVRGPDGIRKDHVAKLLLRWYRRCFIKSAFTQRDMWTPWEEDGGSFTGPSVKCPEYWQHDFEGHNQDSMTEVVKQYLKTVDELPHHFQLHLMHGAEILGYKHPSPNIRYWWNTVYVALANDMHLTPETEEKMDYRLGDKESNWRQCEEVTAQGPPK